MTTQRPNLRCSEPARLSRPLLPAHHLRPPHHAAVAPAAPVAELGVVLSVVTFMSLISILAAIPDNARLRQQITTLATERDGFRDEIIALRSQLGTVSAERDALLAKVAELEEQIRTLQRPVEQVGTDDRPAEQQHILQALKNGAKVTESQIAGLLGAGEGVARFHLSVLEGEGLIFHPVIISRRPSALTYVITNAGIRYLQGVGQL